VKRKGKDNPTSTHHKRVRAKKIKLAFSQQFVQLKLNSPQKTISKRSCKFVNKPKGLGADDLLGVCSKD
jgi:hypothetical protein